MYNILLISIFLAAASGQKYGLYHFPDKDTLTKCLTDYSKTVRNHPGPSPSFINDVAKFFKKGTYTKEEFESDVSGAMNYLDEDYDALQDNRILRRQLEGLLREALLHCTEKQEPFKNKNIPGDHLRREVLPHIAEERPDHAQILNHALVNWPLPLRSMIRTRKRRAVLRRFVDNVLRIIQRSYPSEIMIHSRGLHSGSDIEREMRRLWERRSALFYDYRNPQYRYVDHIFNLDYTFPHTHNDVDALFTGLSNENFNDRNPRVSRDDVREILNTHPVTNPRVPDANDPFYFYENFGMTSAEHYLELHLAQFFRAVFYILELRARGIVTDDDDTYEGCIPNTVMSEDIQEIVYDDDAYREYLLDLTREEVSVIDPDNAHQVNILRSHRVREIDLVMLFLRRLRCQVGCKSKTVVDITHANPSTTEKPRTGAIPKRGRERYFTSVYESCENVAGPSGTQYCGDSGDSQNQKQQKLGCGDLFYGYITDIANFGEEDASTFLSVLKSTLVAGSF